jgi:hypothetical protein
MKKDREVVGFSWDGTGDDILINHESNWGYSFPESMTLEEAIGLFTSVPETIEDADLIETVVRHPVVCSEVAPIFLARLNSDQPDSALVLIDKCGGRLLSTFCSLGRNEC